MLVPFEVEALIENIEPRFRSRIRLFLGSKIFWRVYVNFRNGIVPKLGLGLVPIRDW